MLPSRIAVGDAVIVNLRCALAGCIVKLGVFAVLRWSMYDALWLGQQSRLLPMGGVNATVVWFPP